MAGLFALAVAASASATLYHPELLALGLQRPALIDCEHGFRAALLDYFTHFAPREGLTLAAPPEVTRLDRESAQWISHFEVLAGARRFRGIVYVEPPPEDDDDDNPPPALPPARQRTCSAAFVDGTASPDEWARVEQAYRELCRHLAVGP